MIKNESLERIINKNESFHSSREINSKNTSASRNQQGKAAPLEDFTLKGDNFNNFNQRPNFPNFPNFPNLFNHPNVSTNLPGYDMGYSMYIMNFYEFHLNNMQTIIMQKNEELMVNYYICIFE